MSLNKPIAISSGLWWSGIMHFSIDYNKDTITQVQQAMEKGLAAIRAELEKARLSAQESWPKIEKIKQCGNGSEAHSPISWYETDGFKWYGAIRPVKDVEQRAKKDADAWLEAIERDHADNLPRIESNTKLAAKIRVTMEAICMPSGYSSVEWVRHKRKSERHPAGYESDIGREIICNDFYDHAKRRHEEYVASIKAYVNARKDKEEQERRLKQAEADKQTQLMLLGQYQAKYCLPATASASDVLDAMLSKDKYLALAHAMLKNREDFSDGYCYVEKAVGSFKVETEYDKAIVDDITRIIAGEDVDGRTFRDTTWNYNVVFSRADHVLYKDYTEFKEKFFSELE